MLDRAREEIKQIAFVFLYLLVCFGIFHLHESIVLTEHRISITSSSIAVINALVFSKVMVIAEHLHFARRFHDHPLVMPILYKAVAFALLFIVVHLIENIIAGLVAGRSFVESIPPVGGGGIRGIVVVAVIISTMLMPYFACREIGRVIGEDVLHAALFRRRPRRQGGAQLPKRSAEAATNARGSV